MKMIASVKRMFNSAHTVTKRAFSVFLAALLVLTISPIAQIAYAGSAGADGAKSAASSAKSENAKGGSSSTASGETGSAAKTASASTGDSAASANAAESDDASKTTASADASKTAKAANAGTSDDEGVDNAKSDSADTSDEGSANAEKTSSAKSAKKNAADKKDSDTAAIVTASEDDELEPGKYGQYTYQHNTETNAFESSEYDAYRDPVATNWLGIAGSFHITAFNEVNIGSHVYGNILTKTLNGSNNFGPTSEYGTRYGYQTLSYVQNYPSPSGNPDGKTDGVFIIGSNNTVTKVDNGNHLAINGTQLNSPNTLVQDADTASNPFIDLDGVKSYTTQVSNNLANIADVGATIRQEGSNTYIDYEGDSGCAYVSMTADELNNIDQLYINGMELNGECSVVINVDMNGATELNLSKVHVLLPNGQTAGTGESDNTVGYVMFNIKNSTSDMSINLSDRVLASVLAPNATINLGGSAAGTYIATNVNVTAESHARPFRGTLKPVTAGASVTKQWLDAYGNAESTEVANSHDAVTVQLQQKINGGDWTNYGDAITLSSDNSWTYSWGDSLPKKDTDGTTYEYQVVETSSTADYVEGAPTSSGGMWTITNRHVAVGSLSVSKVWLDATGNVESGHDNDPVIVKVMRSTNGFDFQQYGETITLSARDGWSATIDQLPLKDADGNEYTYKVEEDEVDGYAVSYGGDTTPAVDADGNKSWAYTITNTRESQDDKTSLTLSKFWSDSEDQDGLRPNEVTVDVLASVDGGEAKVVKTVTLRAEDNWTAILADLPAYEDGDAITYSISEHEVNGYSSNDKTATSMNEDGTWSAALTNTHEAKTTAVGVKKTWKDSAGNDEVGVAHDAVTAQLYTVDAQGNLTAVDGKTLELSADNGWSGSWIDLPVYSDGEVIKYTVREVEVPENYKASYEGVEESDGSYSFTITNTCEAEEVAFSLSGYSMKAAAAPVSEPDKVCYVDPKIVKVLDGRTLTAGEFSFQLIDSDGNVISEATNDAAGMVDFDAAHNVAKEGMEPSCLEFTAAGTYTYTVRETPNQTKDSSIDYSDEVIRFVTVIDTDSKGALYEKESYYLKYDNAIDAAAGVQATKYASTDHPSITNKVKTVSLGLMKTSAETGLGLAGAVYGLYKIDESAPEGSVQVASATSNKLGVMLFSSDDASAITTEAKYFFREITAPEGYAVSENQTEAFGIQQTSDGKYQLVYEDGTVSGTASGTSLDPVIYKFGTGVSDEQIAITFGKVASDGTALSGAKLAIRDASGNDVDTWLTDGTGHVVKSLAIDTQYVLYEKSAPNGYKTADEVTFTIDKYGKVTIVSGAGSDDAMNAYATGSAINLIDYQQDEVVTTKEVSREEGVPSNDKTTNGKTTSGTTTSMPKTGDDTPATPFGALAIGAAAVAIVAARRVQAKA